MIGVGSNSPCDDEHPVSSVWGSDGTSRNKHRLNGISVTFKICADSFKCKGFSQLVSVKCVALSEKSGLTCHFRNLALLDHREDSSNVFSHNPSGLDFIDGAVHCWPEIAVIFRASSSPGITERLARKAASEHVHSSAPLCEVCCCNVFITLCIWIPIIEHLAPERVYLAVE